MNPPPNPPAADEESLFARALELPAEARAAFLAEACAGDPARQRRLEALLRAVARSPEFLEQPVTEAAPPPASASEGPGARIGRYKLLQQIGEGGCGTVFMAEQEEPVRRRVALKVIKLGMDTKSVIARFEAERQALALMDHPNIAKVLDAGATDSGRPFFVMELVRGIPITRYCDENRLDTKARLDLFIKACQAIQHAHQKGIIHRDIKPSNILVTLHDGVPVPKVIDFGIAKATEGRLTDRTLFTAFEQFIGTPAYMSPEQAEMSGLDIDTRSDIYSLGVLLYELLAGSTPFDAKELMALGIDAMRKTIREKEPVRPSTRLTQEWQRSGSGSARVPRAESGVAPDSRPSISSSRKGSQLNEGFGGTPQPARGTRALPAHLRTLVHQLKGDLDWIVMKCLEKDRQRRYDTANGLAADIKRHLENEPVTARPPSAAYKFQKAFRRNKLVFAAGTAVAAALVVGLTFSAWQAVRATRAEAQAIVEKAQAQKEKANALVEKANAQAALQFIQDDVLSQASPGYQPDRELTVRALLDRIAGRLDRATGRPPLVEASIRQTLGSVYTELGDYTKAIEHYEAAMRVQSVDLGPSHLETLRSRYGLAMARWWNGDMSQADLLTEQGLKESRRTLGETNALTLQFMQARAFAMMFMAEKPWTEVEPFYLEALALHRKTLGPDNLATLKLMYGLVLGYNLNWQEAKSVPLLATTVDQSRGAVLDEKHPQTAALMAILAYAYSHLNQLDKAEPLALGSLKLTRSVLGETNNRTVGRVLVLARIYLMQQHPDKAEPLIEHALDLSRQLSIEKDPFIALHLANLGWEYLEQGRLTNAETLCELAVQTMRRNLDGNRLVNPRVITPLGAVRLGQKRYAEAEALLRESLGLAERYWPDGEYRFHVMSLLGASLSGQKRHADAEPFLRQGYEGLVQRQASLAPHLNAPRRITEALERLVQLYDAWGKPAQAAEWKQKLAEFQQAANAVEKNGAKP